MLRAPFARIGWQRAANESADESFLRPRLIGVLGDLGDAEILVEAKRRFAAFQRDPAALAPGLRDPVTHLAGRGADRATYDALLALGRRTASGEERRRYYFALASALDPALAAETLRIALGDELPTNLAWSVPGWVASAGEQPDLAWDFVAANLPALAARLGPNYRDNAVANLTWSVADRKWAAALAAFAPGQQTPAGRIATAKAQERILAGADFRAEVLPAVDAWIRERGAR